MSSENTLANCKLSFDDVKRISQRVVAELKVDDAYKKKEYARGYKHGEGIYWPEEDATYWYMDGYRDGEKGK